MAGAALSVRAAAVPVQSGKQHLPEVRSGSLCSEFGKWLEWQAGLMPPVLHPIGLDDFRNLGGGQLTPVCGLEG